MSEQQRRPLIAYPLSGPSPDIRPARPTRDWIDALPQQFAYRCLPLNMANMCGWEICAPRRFSATWDGGSGLGAVKVTGAGSAHDGSAHLLPASHFGHGILTFHVTALFRTPPGVNMLITGPLNHPKDGIYGLSGVIETDWSPYTFTMNWKFTAVDTPTTWEEGEPFAALIPLQRGFVESFDPEFRPLDDDPETAARYREWSQSRNAFNQDLLRPDSDAARERWQKGYYRGLQPDGSPGPDDHQTKSRPKPFG